MPGLTAERALDVARHLRQVLAPSAADLRLALEAMTGDLDADLVPAAPLKHELGVLGSDLLHRAQHQLADGLLALLEARLPNEPADELQIAAGEQAKITRIRLEKIL